MHAAGRCVRVLWPVHESEKCVEERRRFRYFLSMNTNIFRMLSDGTVPLYLAPQAGVSESPFRRLCRAFGADVVVSEFVSSEGLRRGSERTHAYLRFDDAERPIGVQIFRSEERRVGREGGGGWAWGGYGGEV